MQMTTLGRTGLSVSVAGLGCGGNSRLGLGRGADPSECVRLVHCAMDLGVNIFDTAEVYGTESILGEALKGRRRGDVVISTKSRYAIGGRRLTPADVVSNLDDSLRRLKTDYVDVFHIHGVQPKDYRYVAETLVPELVRQREAGKVRFIGITESPPNDPLQAMLSEALDDDACDVAMIGFHMMHQGPRRTVFPVTISKGIGTLIMFAVRNIFSRPRELRETLGRLAASGEIPARYAEDPEPMGFLVHEGGARSLTDAAYRFARHQAGSDVVLFGTGSVDHLEDNLQSITAGPLPAEDLEVLHTVFGNLTGIGLDLPDHVKKTP